MQLFKGEISRSFLAPHNREKERNRIEGRGKKTGEA